MSNKGLPLLIKLKKQEVDENRRMMVMMEGQMAQLLQSLKKLKDEVMQEKDFTAENIAYSHTWKGYLETAQEKERHLIKSIEYLNRNILREKAKVQQGYSELKSYELVHQKHLQEEKDQEEAQERQFLDELATQMYIRKKKT